MTNQIVHDPDRNGASAELARLRDELETAQRTIAELRALQEAWLVEKKSLIFERDCYLQSLYHVTRKDENFELTPEEIAAMKNGKSFSLDQIIKEIKEAMRTSP